VAGTLRVPGDKSISHRSLILSALANGESTIEGILDSEDVRSTAAVLRALGANVPPISQSMRVTGVGLRGLKPPREPLDCGNSGTTTRLMAGVVAAHPFSARFVGDESLSRRPMKRIAEPLTYMGAKFEFEHGDGLPMTVRGVDLRSVDRLRVAAEPVAAGEEEEAVEVAAVGAQRVRGEGALVGEVLEVAVDEIGESAGRALAHGLCLTFGQLTATASSCAAGSSPGGVVSIGTPARAAQLASSSAARAA